jgi:hypothetical protein
MITVWRNAIEVNTSSYFELKKRHAVAQGWRDLGDLSNLLSMIDLDSFTNALFDKIKMNNNFINQKDKIIKTFYNLLHQIKPGDLIIAVEVSQIKGICEIGKNSNYKYDNSYEYANL